MVEEEKYGLYGYRWVVLVSFMLIGALTQLMWLNFAPITSQVQRIMHVSEFQVVLLAIMFPLLYIPVSIPAGIIIDRKGWRYAVMVGAILTTGFAFLRLFTGSYVLVLIGMIGIAIGQPFVLNAITKMTSTWFPTHEAAMATGIATVSLFIGMIVAQALTPPLLKAFGETESGLRMLVLVYSLAALVGLILFVIFGRAKPPKPPKRTEGEIQEEGATINWASVGKIFSIYDFRILCVIIFIGNGAFVGILQLLEKIMQPKHVTTSAAGNIGAVMVFAGIVGCVVIPTLSDKIKKRKPFIVIAAAVTIPGLFFFAAMKGFGVYGLSPSGLTPFFVIGGIVGLFLFAAFPLVLTFAEECTGHGLTGTATAILLLLGNAGGVFITLVMEWIKGATGGKGGSFFWAMMFLVVLFVVALIFAFFLREGKVPEGVGD